MAAKQQRVGASDSGTIEGVLGIKRDVLRITAAIPPGAVTTFGSIGDFMSVIPRQVAYILATLTDDEQRSVPWYRVVSEGGKLGTLKVNALGRSQEALLLAEGVAVRLEVVADFAARFIDAAALEHEVEPHRRYLDE